MVDGEVSRVDVGVEEGAVLVVGRRDDIEVQQHRGPPPVVLLDADGHDVGADVGEAWPGVQAEDPLAVGLFEDGEQQVRVPAE